MSERTKGPWHACNDGKCACKQVWGKDHPVATITSGKWGDDYPTLKVTGPSLQRRVEAVMEQITYGEIDEGEASANAAFIVRCCNAHDELVALLKEIIYNKDVSIYPTAIEGNHNTNFDKWEARVRAAIFKVEGGPTDE